MAKENENSEIPSYDVVEKPDSTPSVIQEEGVLVPAEEIGDDLICASIREDDLPDIVLKAVLGGLAEEQASLKTLRRSKQSEGRDTSHISVKRGTLLKYMSETLIQKQTLTAATGEFDIRGPKFREIFKMFLETISDTFEDVKIPLEYKEMFFHLLSKNLNGWEDRAEKLIKTMGKR